MIDPVSWFFDAQGWVSVAVYALGAAIILIAIVTVPNNRRPTTALAWLFAIYLMPVLGLVLFYLFGTNQLPTRRRRMQAQVDDIVREATAEIDESHMSLDDPAWFSQLVRLNRNLTAIPLAEDNRLELHSSYNRTIRTIADELDTATETIHVLFYAMSYDEITAPFFDALERAARRGVTVRVLYDHIGSFRYRGYRRMKQRLREIGCEWHPTLSIWPWQGGIQRVDLRNHRKIVAIDGRVAYIGSQNLIARDYHKRGSKLQWKDLSLRIEGPMAAGANAVFISDWFGETGELLEPSAPEWVRSADDRSEGYACQLVPSGPGYENENNLRLFNQAFYSAEKRIVIASPYFVPDDSLLYAITTAVQRGVEVELFVGEIGDQFFVYHAQRSYYEALLRAGVRIWLYRAPYILHSKHCTIDDAVTLIGSSNMDMRSFTLNAELMLLVHGSTFVDRVREIENGYRQRSRELTLAEWLDRPLLGRAVDNVARLTSVIQ